MNPHPPTKSLVSRARGIPLDAIPQRQVKGLFWSKYFERVSHHCIDAAWEVA